MAGIYTRSEVDKIIRNSELTDEQKTEHKLSNVDTTPLAKRTNDFIKLEKACKTY